MKTKYMTWTPEKQAFLQKNFKKMKYADLAEKFGCSENAVKTRVHMTIKAKKKTSLNKKKVLELRTLSKEGLTIEQVSKRMRVKANTVRYYSNKANIVRNKRWITPTIAKRLRKDYQMYSNSQLAQRNKIPLGVVKAFLSNHNLKRSARALKLRKQQ